MEVAALNRQIISQEEDITMQTPQIERKIRPKYLQEEANQRHIPLSKSWRPGIENLLTRLRKFSAWVEPYDDRKLSRRLDPSKRLKAVFPTFPIILELTDDVRILTFVTLPGFARHIVNQLKLRDVVSENTITLVHIHSRLIGSSSDHLFVEYQCAPILPRNADTGTG